MKRCYDYDVALREAWAMMTPEMRIAALKRMRGFDEYRGSCADFLEAAYDVEAEVVLPSVCRHCGEKVNQGYNCCSGCADERGP